MNRIAKTINSLGVLCLLSVLCASCFNDDSTNATIDVSDITISGIEDFYQCTAFVGENLNINPQITTGYADDQLSYTWTLLNSATGTRDADRNVVAPEVISNEKNLSLPIELPAGSYQIRLTVKSLQNGYEVTKAANINVVTEFSQGFYIMKETTDGNTDIDLLTTEGALGENLLEKLHGNNLKGKPYSLGMDYGHFFINEQTEQIESAHVIAITTDQGAFNVLNGSDLKVLFNRENMRYEVMDDDELPGVLVRNGMYSLLFTNKGYYKIWTKSMYTDQGVMAPNSGRFGFPDVDGIGGSRWVVRDPGSYGGFFWWDELTHSLRTLDMMASAPMPLLKQDRSGSELTQNLTNYECLGCGMNNMNGTATGIFIMNDKSQNQRYLYTTWSTYGMQILLDRIVVKKGSHMANASMYSVNAMTAKYIYCLDGNNVFGCNLSSADYAETPISFEGIASGEQITYVSDQYWNATMGDTRSNFDYLVIGTQSSNGYGVYMYKMVGGLPDGAPVLTAHGNGKLSAVRFLFGSGMFSDFDTYYSFYPSTD